MDIDPCTLLSFLLSIDLNKSRVMCVGILGEFFFLNKKQRTKRCRGLAMFHLSTTITYTTE